MHLFPSCNYSVLDDLGTLMDPELSFSISELLAVGWSPPSSAERSQWVFVMPAATNLSAEEYTQPSG